MALTTKQLEFIGVLLSNPLMTEKEAALAVGIHPKSVSRWKQKEEFREEKDRRLRENWKEAEALAQHQMINLAKQGSFQANKYILDSLGYAPVQRQHIEAEVTSDINIVIEE